MGANRSRSKTGTIVVGTLFLIPALALMLFTFIVPAVWNLILSFKSWDGFGKEKWVYFDNYVRLLHDPLMQKSMYNSFYLSILTTVVAVVLGTMLAGLLYRLGTREGSVFRLILFMPAMIPLAIIGLLFSFIYSPDMGLLNRLLELFQLGSLTTAWLENKSTVLVCIAIVGIWRMTGLTMILCFASMQMIPVSFFEAGKLDGAKYGKQFFVLVLPLLKPIIRLSAIFTMDISFRSYDLVYVLTEGGPANYSKTLPLYMIDSAFKYSEFGYSAAIGFVSTLCVMLAIYGAARLLRGEQHEY